MCAQFQLGLSYVNRARTAHSVHMWHVVRTSAHGHMYMYVSHMHSVYEHTFMCAHLYVNTPYTHYFPHINMYIHTCNVVTDVIGI